MSEPVSVALTWLNFPLSVLLALQGAVASVTNVYYDMDITILKALFLENDGKVYFRYANNRLFQTLDVAKITTSADIWMQDHALQYVADESNLVLANVTNQSAWLTAFRAAMEVQLTALDLTAMEYDMGSGPSFAELDPGITLSRNASTDEVQVGGATFTSLPFVVGDMVYFDAACTFANSITKTYRVNLRARAPIVQLYPMKDLPPPTLYAVNMYICKPESVPTDSTWTINSIPYTFPFQVVGGLDGVNILLRHGFYVIFSSAPLTIGNDVPAGVYTSGDATIFNWLLQESTDVFETVPTLTADVLVENQYLTDFPISENAQLTAQGKLFFSITLPFTAVDDRIHDSGTAYDLMGFTRQQPYKSQTLAYFQGVRPEPPLPVEGYYFIVPSDTTGLTVTVERQSGTTIYNYADIVAGTYSEIGKTGNKVYLIADTYLLGLTIVPSGIPYKPCVIYQGLFVAVAPLPVTETSYLNTYSNPGFLQTVPPLFSDQGSTFQLTAERIQAGIQTFGSPYGCRRIQATEGDLTYEFLQIEKLTAFTVGEWPDAGFHEDRVSTQLTADVQVRLVINSNGGTGQYNELYNIGNTVSSLNSNLFSKDNATFVKFNTQSDGQGLDFESFLIIQNMLFFAIWNDFYHVTYDKNDAGAVGNQTDATIYDANDTVTVQANTFSFEGFTFMGWNTASDGSGTPYAENDQFPISGDITLYAIWQVSFNITYYNSRAYSGDNNGSPPVDSTAYFAGDTAIILGQGDMSNTSLGTFLGWETGDFILTYTAGQQITMSQGLTLYAVFQLPLNITYYNSRQNSGDNIGSPPVDSTTYFAGDTAIILGQGDMSNTSLGTFLGWETGNFILTYTAGQQITMSQGLPLYAMYAAS